MVYGACGGQLGGREAPPARVLTIKATRLVATVGYIHSLLRNTPVPLLFNPLL